MTAERASQEERHDAPANRRLRPWRRFRGWSLRELERRSGIFYNRIAQYERGDHAVSFRVARQLATALGIHVAYLWDVTMPPVPEPTEKLPEPVAPAGGAHPDEGPGAEA